MWYKITYPFPNFNGAAFKVLEWVNNFIPPFTGHVITFLSILGLKLNHVIVKEAFVGKTHNIDDQQD